MRRKNTFSLAFIISIAIHAALTLFILLKPHVPTRELFKQDDAIEVELLDTTKIVEAMQKRKVEPQNRGQIVEQDEKRLNDEVPVDAKFLSKHNQKVVRETQAALNGKFKNTADSSGKESIDKQLGKTEPEQNDNQESEQEVAKSDEEKKWATGDGNVALKSKPTLKDLTPSFKPALPRLESDEVAKGGGEGPSATDDHLKNVNRGMQTILSTREFVYYAYYNRIKDKLRQYWEPAIKAKMERVLRQGRTIASNQDRITRIVIILDATGTLVRVQVVSASGLQDLDEAAVEAFKAAAPFPNPPKGIQEPDGKIRIRWDFILEA